jgi:hypothetical protein
MSGVTAPTGRPVLPDERFMVAVRQAVYQQIVDEQRPSAEPSAYRVHTGRGSYWASCVWEALGIPTALGIDGRFSATCPDCRETRGVTVADGRCRGEENYVFHFLAPAARFWENIFFT